MVNLVRKVHPFDDNIYNWSRELLPFKAKGSCIKRGCYNIFQEIRALLVQKWGGEKKLQKSVSGYFMTQNKKVPLSH